MLVGLLFIFGALAQLQVLTLATDPIYCIHTYPSATSMKDISQPPSTRELTPFAKETLVDVALDLGVPPVLHERKAGAREVSRRELRADELTQEELLGGAIFLPGLKCG